MLNENEIQHLRETFQEIDRDKTGMISAAELEAAFQKGNQKSPSAQRIKQIVAQVDYKGNGKINYTEFLAATVSVQQVLTNEKLYALFKHFDIDDSEYITPENIREAFAVNGREITDAQLKDILSSHDMTGDGRLTFEEFKAIFFENVNMEMRNNL